MLKTENFDVVVLGGGSAGICAAIAAARNGMRVALVEGGSVLGGELLSGIPVDGAVNLRGEWMVGGPAREIFDACAEFDGYVGAFCDWRMINCVCVDPEAMKLAVARVVARHGVRVLLHTICIDAEVENGCVRGLVCLNKAGRHLLRAQAFIDASGDADLTRLAGGRTEIAPPAELQPVSLIFRMSGVNTSALLDHVRAHPEDLSLGEAAILRGARTDADLAEELYRQGQPIAFFKAEGPLLGGAIRDGSLYPTSLLMVTPTSTPRREVAINSTRVARLDATDTAALSRSFAGLTEQVAACLRFLKGRVPGFEDAHFSGVASKVGIRETYRVVGEEMLTGDDVRAGRKNPRGIAKGCHHVDIHGEGTNQLRVPVANGGSYDIPYGCLVPQGFSNLLVAGRCLSADREGQGSARVMAQCMAMGQATGTASALWITGNARDPLGELPVERLRSTLRDQGAVIEGTH